MDALNTEDLYISQGPYSLKQLCLKNGSLENWFISSNTTYFCLFPPVVLTRGLATHKKDGSSVSRQQRSEEVADLR